MPERGRMIADEINRYTRYLDYRSLPNITKINYLLKDLKSWHEPTYIHSLNVAHVSRTIANFDSSLSQGQRGKIYKGALLHDIGKLFVPQRILSRKSNNLVGSDYKILVDHGDNGGAFLEDLGFDQDYVDIAKQHYIGAEYRDGKYIAPNDESLRTRNILTPYITIADILVGALDSERRYKKNYNPKKVIEGVLYRFRMGWLPKNILFATLRAIDIEYPQFTNLWVGSAP